MTRKNRHFRRFVVSFIDYHEIVYCFLCSFLHKGVNNLEGSESFSFFSIPAQHLLQQDITQLGGSYVNTQSTNKPPKTVLHFKSFLHVR